MIAIQRILKKIILIIIIIRGIEWQKIICDVNKIRRTRLEILFPCKIIYVYQIPIQIKDYFMRCMYVIVSGYTYRDPTVSKNRYSIHLYFSFYYIDAVMHPWKSRIIIYPPPPSSPRITSRISYDAWIKVPSGIKLLAIKRVHVYQQLRAIRWNMIELMWIKKKKDEIEWQKNW